MMVYKASVREGKFYAKRPELNDGEYLMLIIPVTNRTPRESQNYYFVQLGEWANSTGYTKEELHDLVKGELFQELFPDVTSTTSLTEHQWHILFLNLSNFLTLKFENR